MTLDDDIVFLGRIATFRVLGRDAMRILAISAQSEHLQSGEQLFEEGAPADCGFVIVEGSVELKRAGERAGGSIVAGAGTLIGEIAMVADTLRPAAATALERTTLLRIPRSVFLRVLQGEPDAAVALRDLMVNRLGSTLSDLDVVTPLFEDADAEQDFLQDD